MQKAIDRSNPAAVAARAARARAEIAAAWDVLDAALADGTLSRGQWSWMMTHEPASIDDDTCDPLILTLWSRQVRRWAEDPRGVSANLEAMRTFPCRCAEGRGWLYTVVDGKQYAKPCPDCNSRQRSRWAECWSQGPDHHCQRCAPKKAGRYNAHGNPHDEERKDQDAAELEDLI
jgi:hypothetical protein